nr:hypothetical protein [Fimbriiglobus ruber]
MARPRGPRRDRVRRSRPCGRRGRLVGEAIKQRRAVDPFGPLAEGPVDEFRDVGLLGCDGRPEIPDESQDFLELGRQVGVW